MATPPHPPPDPPRSWLGATAALVAGGGLELAVASVALCGQRVALPLAVLWLGGPGQAVAAGTVGVAAALGFVRAGAGYRLAARARQNLLELYLRPLQHGSPLALPPGDEVSARLSVAFPTLASWAGDGLTSLLGGALAVPIVVVILIRSLGLSALVPLVLGGAAGALVTVALARRVDAAWNRSWSHWRKLTLAIGNAHRCAIELRAHGRAAVVADDLRAEERAWSAADARARMLVAAHSWGAVGAAALVAALAGALVDSTGAGGQGYLGWLLALAALPAAQTLVAGAAVAHTVRTELDAVERQRRVVLDEPGEADEPIDALASIRLEHVSFAYPARPGAIELEPVLRDLCLTLPPRAGVAVVGRNGSGKTTLLHLLLGILRPGAGRILVGEREARLDNQRWRSRVAYVPQEPFVLADRTIAENMRFFDTHTKDDALIAALRDVKLWDTLRARAADDDAALALPLSHLSQGQARRVALARALLRDADTLFLDEPEASLDAASVVELEALLASLARQKRVVAAVHDRALLAWADVTVELGAPDRPAVELAS